MKKPELLYSLFANYRSSAHISPWDNIRNNAFSGKKSVNYCSCLALGLYSNFEGSWHAKKYKSVRGCPPTVRTGTGNVVCTDMLYYRFCNGVWVCLLAHGPINGGGLISGYRPVGLYARNYGKQLSALLDCTRWQSRVW